MVVEPIQKTPYQRIKAEIEETKNKRKAILAKLTRAEKKNDGNYPSYVAALSKESHNKRVDIIQLQDQLAKYSL